MINPKKQKKKRILMIAMAIIHSLSIRLLQKMESEKLLQFSRKPIIGRKRAKIVNIRRYLGKNFFRRAYQMSEERFDELSKLLQPYVAAKCRVGPNGDIPLDLELSIALRYFAGGSPLDFIASHDISHSSIWNLIWRIINAINECEQLQIQFPTDHSIQRQIAASLSALDFISFLRSKLYTKLPGFLADGHVIFGDNAYVSTEYMVTPYKNIRASAKDDFNFFHSQL
jgi:hypothetical protein